MRMGAVARNRAGRTRRRDDARSDPHSPTTAHRSAPRSSSRPCSAASPRRSATGKGPRLRQLPPPAARIAPGRNPGTGDRVDVPLKHVAYFTSGKELINRDPALPVPPPLSE